MQQPSPLCSTPFALSRFKSYPPGLLNCSLRLRDSSFHPSIIFLSRVPRRKKISSSSITFKTELNKSSNHSPFHACEQAFVYHFDFVCKLYFRIKISPRFPSSISIHACNEDVVIVIVPYWTMVETIRCHFTYKLYYKIVLSVHEMRDKIVIVPYRRVTRGSNRFPN